MATYFIGLGSNIAPRRNVPSMLEALLAMAPRIALSRIIDTAPIEVTGGGRFLNLVAAFECADDPVVLKERLNAIEASLGRDRSVEDRHRQARTADLDILFTSDRPLARLASGDVEVFPIPAEPYSGPPFRELLAFLGGESGVAHDGEPPIGISVTIQGADRPTVGTRPMWIRRAGGRDRARSTDHD